MSGHSKWSEVRRRRWFQIGGVLMPWHLYAGPVEGKELISAACGTTFQPPQILPFNPAPPESQRCAGCQAVWAGTIRQPALEQLPE